jgi:hypothetical protein
MSYRKGVAWGWGLVGIAVLPGCATQTKVTAACPPGTVPFQLQELGAIRKKGSDTHIWLATHTENGKTARFQIKLALKPATGAVPIAFTSGVLYHERNSDASALLPALAHALEAKKTPAAVKKQDHLPFQAAIVGENLTQSPDGDLVAEPKGHWTAIKVFVRGGEGEFFLNLDPDEGQGEFSIKDPEYGDIVVQELAKVL